jgi:hypothetical protein
VATAAGGRKIVIYSCHGSVSAKGRVIALVGSGPDFAPPACMVTVWVWCVRAYRLVCVRLYVRVGGPDRCRTARPPPARDLKKKSPDAAAARPHRAAVRSPWAPVRARSLFSRPDARMVPRTAILSPMRDADGLR